MDDVFNYLKEEQALTIANLSELVQNFSDKNREEVFDEVKLVCDQLRGYLKKQSVLLIDELENKNEKGYSSLLKETKKMQDQLFDDLETIVMVHVDEPGYGSYLSNLLKHAEDYFAASQKLFVKLRETLPEPTLNKVNEKLATIIHSDVGFNSIQTPEIEQARAAKQP